MTHRNAESLRDSLRPLSIEMRHIRLVAAISELGSVTSAARALNLTQPALSRQLGELESRLKTALFIRTSRRMIPTQAGEELGQVSRTVLDHVTRFELQAANGRFSEAIGSIRITVEAYTAYHWLPAVLAEFEMRWPGVRLSIVPEHAANPLGVLRDGAVDLAIVQGVPADPRITTQLLLEDPIVVVVSPTHRLAGRPFVVAEDFRNEHLIFHSESDSMAALARELLAPVSITPQRTSGIQLTQAILGLVASGMGIGLMSQWAAAPAIRSGTVAGLPFTEDGFARAWYVATRTADPPAAWRSDLVELLRRHLASLDSGQGQQHR
jgi:LysR family transcriptional regulator for metE and metH